MSRIRLYVDEDAAETAIVNALLIAGYDVLTAHEAATLGDDDPKQLEYAIFQGRTVYTLNTADFAMLHSSLLASGRTHAGIITIPEQRYSAREKIRRILALLNITTAEEMVDRIVYL
jgi:hypothetical protein